MALNLEKITLQRATISRRLTPARWDYSESIVDQGDAMHGGFGITRGAQLGLQVWLRWREQAKAFVWAGNQLPDPTGFRRTHWHSAITSLRILNSIRDCPRFYGYNRFPTNPI